jgi:hypothetical protein
MFLLQKSTHNLVEVLSVQELFNPCSTEVLAQCHAGEELQEPETFLKSELMFPSGEELPRCWSNPHYREMETKTQATAVAI